MNSFGQSHADSGELFHLAAEIGREPKLDQLLLMILEKSRPWIQAEACSIFLPDPLSGELVIHSAQGTSSPQLGELRIPHGCGLVGIAMSEKHLVRVDDVQNDPRFYSSVDKKTGWVTRALLAAPLLDGDRCIGVIEFLNPIGRKHFSCRDEEMVEYFSSLVAASLVRIEFNEVAVKRAQLQRDLDLAREMQEGLLSTDFPKPDADHPFDLYAQLNPAYEVSGDLYDFFYLSDGRLCFLVGDVADKGVAAGLFMAVTRTLIRAVAIDRFDPVEILSLTNKQLCPSNKAMLFITVVLALYDSCSGSVNYALAGHNPPVLLKSTGEAEYLPPGGQPLGIFEDAYFGSNQLTLARGDIFFIYSDGVTEAMNASHGKFGEDQLLATLANRAGLSAQEITELVTANVNEHVRGAEQSDDITLMTLKRL